MSPPPSPKPCPICDRPVVAEHAPFCSRGCKDRDLLKWLGEGYAVPARPTDDEDAEGLDMPDARPL